MKRFRWIGWAEAAAPAAATSDQDQFNTCKPADPLNQYKSSRTSPSAGADPRVLRQGFLQPLSARRTVPGPGVVRWGRRLMRLHDAIVRRRCHSIPLRDVRWNAFTKMYFLRAARGCLVKIAHTRVLKIKSKTMKYVLLTSGRAPTVDALHVTIQSASRRCSHEEAFETAAPGAHAIKGDLLKIDGEFYVVKDASG